MHIANMWIIIFVQGLLLWEWSSQAEGWPQQRHPWPQQVLSHWLHSLPSLFCSSCSLRQNWEVATPRQYSTELKWGNQDSAKQCTGLCLQACKLPYPCEKRAHAYGWCTLQCVHYAQTRGWAEIAILWGTPWQSSTAMRHKDSVNSVWA